MNKKRAISIILFPVMFFITGFCFSQNQNFDTLLEYLSTKNYEKIELEFKKIDTTKISKYDKATWLYYFAEYKSMIDQHDIAYINANKARNEFKARNELRDVIDCDILIINILNHQNNLNIDIHEIINELIEYAEKYNDPNTYVEAYKCLANKYIDKDDSKNALLYLRKIIPIVLKEGDTVREGRTYINIGLIQDKINNDEDSAFFYYEKAEKILKKQKDYKSLAYTYNNKAEVYRNNNNCNKAEEYYIKADSINFKANITKSKIIFYKNMSNMFIECQEYKKAYAYLDKLVYLKDSINDTNQNIAIVKFNNKELKENNKKIERNRKLIQKFLFGSLVFLFFGSIIFYLLQKNTKRKQLLAEQDKALEKQKVATLLKDQEINSINAMIEGQEKERQRIANDLHDDLGGLMATVKLQFNVLKEQQTPELFNTTNRLLDEAYNKVRSIAHAKNSGVIAKQGLLKAVKNMAHNVSSASTIDIEVTDYGLESRLENSLELTIFRIIQELTTNIIKHAEATHATISLTNHEDSLNIMIEDNGKGFNTNKVVQNNGMGLHSIEKRVEHLEGELKIESQPNQGTTIIIDIPL